MATAADVQTVMENVNEPDTETYSDEYISALVDAGSVASASAVIWKRKAASYAELVNVSEAGASRSMSDLHKNALTMAKTFETEAAGGSTGIGRAKTHPVMRA